MEFDEQELRARLKTTPPACFHSMRVSPGLPPEKWADKDVVTWKLACACGSEHGQFLGYPLSTLKPGYTGPAFVSPLAFRCAECGIEHQVLDTDQHGYHAYVCDSRSHITGEGEKQAYACAKCSATDLSVVVCLFYWDAVMDLVEDEPEEFADKVENCFNEFFAFGRCRACGEELEMAAYSKL